MFGIPDIEILLIAVVALILFGDKLPAMMRKLGKNLSHFQRSMNEMREQVKKSVDLPDHAQSEQTHTSPENREAKPETSEIPKPAEVVKSSEGR